MLTGEVVEMGNGARYRNVLPLSADAKAMRFDVLVLDLGKGNRGVSLTLDERSFYAPMSNPEKASEALREQQNRAE
jgi:hypothetical protein